MIPFKTSLLLLTAALGASSLYADETKPTAPDTASVTDTAAITISVNPAARPVAEGFVGLSYEKRCITVPDPISPESKGLVALLKGLGPGVFRIGGTSSDGCDWDATSTGKVFRKVAPATLERLAGFLNAAGWKCIYGINLSKNTPEIAAEEAAAVARILKDRLLCFQIGNEPDAYAGQKRRPEGYGYKEYMAEWNVYTDAIAKAVPGAVFAGPSTSYKMSFVLPMAKDAKGRLSLLTNHYYVGSGDPASPGSSIEHVLSISAKKQLEPMLAKMRQATEENSLPIGFRVDETCMFYGHPGMAGKVSAADCFASALWAADTLFTCAELGTVGVNFHVGGPGPIKTIKQAAKEPEIKMVHPEFYGLRFFTEAARGVPMTAAVTATGNKLPLRVHAFADKGGVIRISLANVNASGDCAVTLDLPADIRRAESTLALTAPALDATDGVLLGGSPIGVDGSWNPKPAQPLRAEGRGLRVVVPAGSALLVTATTKLPDSPTPKPSH